MYIWSMYTCIHMVYLQKHHPSTQNMSMQEGNRIRDICEVEEVPLFREDQEISSAKLQSQTPSRNYIAALSSLL